MPSTEPRSRKRRAIAIRAARHSFSHRSTDTSRHRSLRDAANATHPAVGLLWREALAYCRYVSKDLPTDQEWTKALRGGLLFPGGAINRRARRNLPNGGPAEGADINVRKTASSLGSTAVATALDDISTYGVRDLAGNVQEWTKTPSPDRTLGFVTTRGGNWENTTTSALVDYISIQNPRPIDTRDYALGFRCRK